MFHVDNYYQKLVINKKNYANKIIKLLKHITLNCKMIFMSLIEFKCTIITYINILFFSTDLVNPYKIY